MSDEVKIALISATSAVIAAGLGFIGTLLRDQKKSREEEIKEAKRQQYQDDRDDYFDKQIESVKKKLDEHNHYAKKFEECNIRLTGLEKDVSYLREDFKNVVCKPIKKK